MVDHRRIIANWTGSTGLGELNNNNRSIFIYDFCDNINMTVHNNLEVMIWPQTLLLFIIIEQHVARNPSF